ncbi:PREDICTED: E3 ubiquitin-protein ligase XIAP [Papilio polytes]|uniref:E3 ubiquitin-protein ligase XIAP n=1 Tax=Papilio polytes TaxID=76194 RepID=UPI0006768848|nr:PREDICTED: E3 ubiquitin-protein ligase XIAP [Papilio polytes]
MTMNLEINRLNTFTNWPACALINPVRIAKAGFFYTGQGTEVQCFSCNGKLAQWNCGDQVMGRHRMMSPNCAFVLDPQSSGNVPFMPGGDSPSTDEPVALSESPQRSSPDDQNNDESPQDYGHTEEDEMYKTSILRLLSFTNWVDSSVSQEALVNAGFYHAGEGRLRCAWCGGELAPFRNFGTLGSPLEVHRMYFPRCAHAIALEAEQRNNYAIGPTQPWEEPDIPDNTDNNRPQSSGAVLNARVMAAGESWRSLGVVGGGARHAAYASLASRLQTFSRWPADRPQDPKALAEAGFYYTGIDDQVRCFYCDGGLGKWEAGDAPWSEHAHWFPHCGYLLLAKGQEFVDTYSNKASVQRTLSADSGLSSRRRNPRVKFPVTDSQVEECMEGAAVLAALGAGLDAARVRRAIVHKLRSTGLPFSSSEALIDAVLDEQLNEEPFSTTPQRLARDILAVTLQDLPASRLIPPFRRGEESESRSDSDSPSASPTPAARYLAPSRSRNVVPSRASLPTQPSRSEKSQTRSLSSSKERKISGDKKRQGSPAPQKKELTLEEENRQLKEARLCKVCMDSEVSVVFLPCGHLVSCAGCGAALAACPLCRAVVRALVRAYLA